MDESLSACNLARRIASKIIRGWPTARSRFRSIFRESVRPTAATNRNVAAIANPVTRVSPISPKPDTRVYLFVTPTTRESEKKKKKLRAENKPGSRNDTRLAAVSSLPPPFASAILLLFLQKPTVERGEGGGGVETTESEVFQTNVLERDLRFADDICVSRNRTIIITKTTVRHRGYY